MLSPVRGHTASWYCWSLLVSRGVTKFMMILGCNLVAGFWASQKRKRIKPLAENMMWTVFYILNFSCCCGKLSSSSYPFPPKSQCDHSGTCYQDLRNFMEAGFGKAAADNPDAAPIEWANLLNWEARVDAFEEWKACWYTENSSVSSTLVQTLKNKLIW